MNFGDSSSDLKMVDNNAMDITLMASIKEELLDDADVEDRLSDVETEDDGDVVIVDAEKTMQYLSGMKYFSYSVC